MGPRTRLSVTKSVVFNVALILTFVSITALAKGNVGQNYCPHGGNLTATHCLTGLNGETYTGVYGEWHNNTIQIYDTSYFVDHGNEAMWVYTTADEQYQVEIGVRIGWVTTSWEVRDCDSCYEYAVYSVENTPLAGGTEYKHWISNTPINGGNHTYMIVSDPNYASTWQVWY